MNKTAMTFLSILIFSVALTEYSYADSSTTTIINNTNSSSSNSSSSNCHTSVHMETNGKVQEYNSDNCGDIHMQSDNSHSTVNITNNTGSNIIDPSITLPSLQHTQSILSPTILTPTISIDQQKIKDQIAKEKAKLEKQKKEIQTQQENFLQAIAAQLTTFFSKLHFF